MNNDTLSWEPVVQNGHAVRCTSMNHTLCAARSVSESTLGYTESLVKAEQLLSDAFDTTEERLVKSSDRVRDLGEVFTPSATVEEMLNLLPREIWTVHPSSTFLEPACGDGNFLIAILNRKLDQVAKAYSAGELPAGDSEVSAQYHALQALASIYAVDISSDNIIGGTPGHEIGARTRLLNRFTEWNLEVIGNKLSDRNVVMQVAEWIVEHNLIVGNMLATDANGKPTGRDDIPLIEYSWEPKGQRVVLMKTTLGDVIEVEEEKTAINKSLFAPSEPEEFWSGKALNLRDAERTEAPKLRGPARNGTGRR